MLTALANSLTGLGLQANNLTTLKGTRLQAYNLTALQPYRLKASNLAGLQLAYRATLTILQA